MTIDKGFNIIIDLKTIKTEQALKFLEMELTTENMKLAEDYLNSYWRNR
jgi:dynactin complex subunit